MEKMAKNLMGELWFQVVVALLAGIGIGLLLSPSGAGRLNEQIAEKIAAPWIALPGNIFLALIKMVVIPLVLSSVALGIASSPDPNFLKKTGPRLFSYFVVTTTVAVTIGISLATMIQPGKSIQSDLVAGIMEGNPNAETGKKTGEGSHMADRITDLIPTNYVKSALEEDMLATVILALFIGVALISSGSEKKQVVRSLLGSIQDISLKIIGWAMKLAPLAVFGLICSVTIRIGLEAIWGMAIYVGTVLLGLLGLLIFYQMVVLLFGRMNPLIFFKEIREVLLLAFSTSSSAAVMPLSMKNAEENLKVPPRISRFVIPIGATINMDGTALYQVVAAIFLTQVYGIFWTCAALL